MSWLDKHRRQQGGSIKDSHTLTNVNFANRNFNDSLAHQVVQIEDEYYDTRFIIKREYNTSSKAESELLIFRPFVEVFRGQIAEFRNHKWLIFNVDTGELAPKGYIRMCNKTLKFDNGAQYPCVVDTNIREYQSIKDMARLNLMSNIMKVMVTSNEDTWNIRETDRFIFDGLAWEVQGVDRVAYTTHQSGVIEFVIQEVPLNEDEKEEIEDGGIVADSDYNLKIIGKNEVALSTETDYTTELYRDGALVNAYDYTTTWSTSDGDISSDGRLLSPNKVTEIDITATYQYVNADGNYEDIIATKKVDVFEDSWGWN